MFHQYNCPQICSWDSLLVGISSFDCVLNLLRSERERGLHERAQRMGVSLPCKISYRTIPVRKSPEDNTVEFIDWPFLLPQDFAPRIDFKEILLLTNHVSWCGHTCPSLSILIWPGCPGNSPFGRWTPALLGG